MRNSDLTPAPCLSYYITCPHPRKEYSPRGRLLSSRGRCRRRRRRRRSLGALVGGRWLARAAQPARRGGRGRLQVGPAPPAACEPSAARTGGAGSDGAGAPGQMGQGHRVRRGHGRPLASAADRPRHRCRLRNGRTGAEQPRQHRPMAVVLFPDHEQTLRPNTYEQPRRELKTNTELHIDTENHFLNIYLPSGIRFGIFLAGSVTFCHRSEYPSRFSSATPRHITQSWRA